MKSRSIAVVGSLNVDFVTTTERLPEAGETLTAKSFDVGYGGKGANQAVACARLASSAKVSMIGQLGDDHFGEEYLSLLKKENIDTDSIKIIENAKTGVANILVETNGMNRILYAANANYVFSSTYDAGWDMPIDGADVSIFQLEMPLAVVLHNLHRSQQTGQHVILNPSPAVPLPRECYSDINTLVVNETEAQILSGKEVIEENDLDFDGLATQFFDFGVRDAIIITLGSEGMFFATKRTRGRVAAKKVKVVDTTGAGDTFLGAYAVSVAESDSSNFDIEASLRFATAASAVAVGRNGAMASIPHRAEVVD